ncbi:hypothetical protein ABG768_018720 [Culter alburnus]|uniref:Uncharacterized protein n=1 Tax=Culter alburnus TaxID=194366 RepID=A0AAW2AT24_CULAL
MLGQEPRLPVDFLLGRVQEPVAGSVHEWIREHQARLQVAFEGAKERLQVAAQRRKVRHDQQVRDIPLLEGQLVYLREQGHKGRHKTQDLWSLIEYQVVRAPKEGGGVYSIAPRDDLNKVKNVHRSLLKGRVLKDAPVEVSSGKQLESLEGSGQEEEQEEEVDLVGVIIGGPAAVHGEFGTSDLPMRTGSQSPRGALDLATSEPVSSSGELEVVEIIPAPVLSPWGAGPPEARGTSVRRTGRVTAGYHSNPHHLPRTGRVVPSTPSASNSVVAIFRPWN